MIFFFFYSTFELAEAYMEQIEHRKMACRDLINLWRFGPQTLPNLISTLIIGTVVANKKKRGLIWNFQTFMKFKIPERAGNLGQFLWTGQGPNPQRAGTPWVTQGWASALWSILHPEAGHVGHTGLFPRLSGTSRSGNWSFFLYVFSNYNVLNRK